jgi:hypothetical protein
MMTAYQKHLVAAARRLARQLGARRLTLARFRAETGTPLSRIYRAFPEGWCQLCATAGLTAGRPQYRLTDDQLFAAMRDAFLAQGGVTSAAAFARHFAHAFNVLRRRGWTWGEALAAFRAWALVHAPDFPYLDRLPRGRRPQRRRSALERALLARQCPEGPGRDLGPRIDFRGCLYAPTNEQSVVFLFGTLAEDLGFAIETLGTRFPDGVAKLRLASGGFRHVRFEVEHKASNFVLHGHDPDQCELVVCWENDWPDAPIPILELKAEVARLAKLDKAAARGGKK